MTLNTIKLITLAVLAATISSCSTKQAQTSLDPENFNNLDSVSYAIGLSIGNNMKKSGAESFNYNAIAEGVRVVLEGDSAKLWSAETAGEKIQAHFSALQQAEIDANKQEGVDYMEAYKEKENVQTSPSGVLYTVIEEGTGEIPKDGDQVTVHYTGKLIDGTIFDSSVMKGKPATFGVNGVIKGWSEVLKMMPVGSKWEVVIPADLAYGSSRGPSQSLPPYSTLIFEIELLDIAQAGE